MRIDDAELDALIRASRLGRESEEFAVAPESVHAYLSGTATAEQKLEVRRALARSTTFRRELLNLAGYLESLAGESATPVSWTAWLGTAAGGISRWFQELSPRWAAFAPVAALLAALIVVPVARERRFGALTPVGIQIMEAREIASDAGTPRGEPTTHLEALLGSLQACLANQGGYEFVAPEVPADLEFPADLTIRLVDDRGAKLRTIHMHPLRGTPAVSPEAVMAWIVTLQPGDESVHVQSFPVTRRHFTLPGVAQLPAVFAMTVAQGGHFKASSCWRLPPLTTH